MAERDSGHNRGHDTTIGAREVHEEPVTHDRHNPSHLMDDMLGLDIDDAPKRVFEGSDERVGTMLLWHFIEEIELWALVSCSRTPTGVGRRLELFAPYRGTVDGS